ncbi:MAG: sulfite oxidase heme-binding subunit YedZ [Acidobacteriota bacterium]
MTWLKSNCRWAALNLFAVSVMLGVITLGSKDWNAKTFDPELESGKWAIRFLLTCLAMTPLNTYFGWSSAIRLRKPTGLWAFAFASLHVLFYISDAQLNWLRLPIPSFMVLGLLGLAVLTVLGITSNRWAMKRMGKNWKRLHRLVYLASAAVASHAILATTASKKLAVRDPQSVHELQIYLGILVVLLAVRLPQVRRVAKQIAALWRSRRQADLPILPVAVPDRQPGCPPKIYVSDVGMPVIEFSREFQLGQDVENAEDDVPAPMDLPLAR